MHVLSSLIGTQHAYTPQPLINTHDSNSQSK